MLVYIPLITPKGETAGSFKVRDNTAVLTVTRPCSGRSFLISQGEAVPLLEGSPQKCTAPVDAVACIENGSLIYYGLAPNSKLNKNQLRSILSQKSTMQSSSPPKPAQVETEPILKTHQEETPPLAQEGPVEEEPSPEPTTSPKAKQLETKHIPKTHQEETPPLAQESPVKEEPSPEPNISPKAEQDETKTIPKTHQDKTPPLAQESPVEGEPSPEPTPSPKAEQVETEPILKKHQEETPPLAQESPTEEEPSPEPKPESEKVAAPTIDETAEEVARFKLMMERAEAVFARMRGNAAETKYKPIPQATRPDENAATKNTNSPSPATKGSATEEANREGLNNEWLETVSRLVTNKGGDGLDRAAETLSQIFPDSVWVTVRGEGIMPHLEGEWQRANELFKIIAVPGSYAPRPPKHLFGFTRFIRTRQGGFWLKFLPR